ncbi:hypothetical protein BC826DRAFT_282851 [Russula brevipes]|nr:hypothetical protein BC826DRAFT_282851 [Russula brevipes]
MHIQNTPPLRRPSYRHYCAVHRNRTSSARLPLEFFLLFRFACSLFITTTIDSHDAPILIVRVPAPFREHRVPSMVKCLVLIIKTTVQPQVMPVISWVSTGCHWRTLILSKEALFDISYLHCSLAFQNRCCAQKNRVKTFPYFSAATSLGTARRIPTDDGHLREVLGCLWFPTVVISGVT